MKIAFLQETVNQNIGIMYLSAVLKSKGHHCDLFVESLEKDFIGAVKAYQPDIVGFSIITGGHLWALNIAGCLKKLLPKTLTVFGGHHPMYFPEIVQQPQVDAIARGESEVSFPELINRLERGDNYSDILGFWVKKDGKIHQNDVAPLIDDISSLPHPDHQLYLKYIFYRDQSEVPFSITRGCPFRCAFCYNQVKAELYRDKGKYLRTRNVEDIISEMDMALKIYPKMNSVILYEGIGWAGRKWLSDFTLVYRERVGLSWITSIRADFVDEFMVEELAKSNCSCLALGVETGDEVIREKILGKRIPNSQYVLAARLLHKAGIKVRTSNMFFLPQEDINKAFKTVDLNREMKADFTSAYTLQPYPGTDIYDYAVKNGFLSAMFKFDDIDPLCMMKPIIELRDKSKIIVLHRLFHYAVRNSFMRRLLDVLISVPPNPLFDLLYYFSLILGYAQYHRISLLRAICIAWNNYRCAKKNMITAGGS
ncbi:MAG: radical SAM protein [Candidatus Omnitrophota bacterium]